MYTIEKKHYGLHITMGGIYSPDEIKKYVVEKEHLISEIEKPFSMFIDLRSAIPPNDEDEELLEKSQLIVKERGLLRMAVITTSPILELQAKQIFVDAGVIEFTKIINATKSPDWEETALNWILYGTEPEFTHELEPKSNSAVKQ